MKKFNEWLDESTRGTSQRSIAIAQKNSSTDTSGANPVFSIKLKSLETDLEQSTGSGKKTTDDRTAKTRYKVGDKIYTEVDSKKKLATINSIDGDDVVVTLKGTNEKIKVSKENISHENDDQDKSDLNNDKRKSSAV